MRHRRHSLDRLELLRREIVLDAAPRPARRAVRVAAGSPSPYYVAMSNLGFHFLYAGLRAEGSLGVERFYADTAPVTIEAGTRLSSFAALLFSVSYEEDYLNLVRMLHESGVPPLRESRRGSPLVIAGGPAVSANPFPLAEIVDVSALGEGEGTLEEIARVLEGAAGVEPRAILERLARIPGVLVHGVSSGRVSVRTGAASSPFVQSAILTPETAFPDTLLIETGRGCPGACAFCLATSIYAPYRHVSLDAVERIVSSAPVPVRRVGLVSTAVAANPDFTATVRRLASMGTAVSFSSLRAEDIDAEKARLIGEIGTSSVSLAPESGSEALRFKLGKRVPDETYHRAGALLREAGVRRFTLYLLIGVPAESYVTFDETKRFIERFKLSVNGARVDVHLNPLIPKAWTPLQYYAMPEEVELEKRQARYGETLRGVGVGVRTKSVRSALRQALLSAGDERVGRAIVEHVTKGVSWKGALRASSAAEHFPHETKGPDSSFPWDAIEGPARRGFLYKRYLAMTEG